jgi:AraC-like DNA-binding protein
MALDWNRLRVRLGHHGRVRTEPGWRLGEKWNANLKDCDLWVVWAGRGVVRFDVAGTRSLVLRPGLCLWMRPGSLYLADHDPRHPLGVSYVHFDLEERRGNAWRPVPRAQLPGEVHELSDLEYVEGILRRVRQLAARKEPATRSVAEILFRGLLMDLGSGLLQAPLAGSATAQVHRRVCTEWAQRLREECPNARALSGLVRQSGYHPDHFTRLFRQAIGQSPRDFVVRARLEKAVMLLRESELTVTEVADALGYQNVYFFSRQFKEKLGQPPSEYGRGRHERKGRNPEGGGRKDVSQFA